MRDLGALGYADNSDSPQGSLKLVLGSQTLSRCKRSLKLGKLWNNNNNNFFLLIIIVIVIIITIVIIIIINAIIAICFYFFYF